jgi:hypothetical protein
MKKEDEIDRSCSTEEGERMQIAFLWESQKERYF